MKADTLPPTGTPGSSTTPTTDYMKPVLTPTNAGGLSASGPGLGAPPPGPELALNVECGPNKAWFYVGRLCQGSKGPCVLFNGAWLTPNEFQYVSGRETAKDWKRSIRHHGKSMKLLITKGILAISPPTCQCDVCTGCAENNNNLDVNKRAAEIAARKAAAEGAAAGLEATSKTTTTNISELTSGMADNSSGSSDDRLADIDGGNDVNSPAKESRLTNIIEAIKSKKKKDDGTTDSSAQKENRPNSRPSSRSGTKKKKEITTENGVGSPEAGSPPGSPVSMATLDIVQMPRPELSLSPTVAATTTPDNSSPEAATCDAAPASDAESDTEANDDVIPDDVSRTRGYDWSTRQAKKEALDNKAAEPTHASAPTLSALSPSHQAEALKASPAPAFQSLTNHIRSLASRDSGLSTSEAGSSSEGPMSPSRQQLSPGSLGRWSPSCSLPKVLSGTDSKPPLLSANRSITTATSCITKPIVSTGTAMFTSALPKDQRESCGRDGGSSTCGKEGKEESSKVYAPINWPPVASEVNSEVKSSSDSAKSASNSNSESRTTETSSMKVSDLSKASSESRSSSDRRMTPEKTSSSNVSEDRGRPSRSPPLKVGVKASEVPPASSNYSDYLRHLGRVPGAPPPGMDDESYVAMMRRYYEWYEMTRLYGAYGLPPGAAPTSSPALARPSLPPHHPAAYDQHSLLSMYHPYYYQHPATADPYRAALGATSLPQEWARLSTLSEQERETLLAQQRAAEAGSRDSTSPTSGSSTQGLKRAFPGEMTREEALDLSVNKKQKLAESLAARDSAALLYSLHAASGFRHPQYAAMGAPPNAGGYPGGMGSLELAAAYPGLWGLPHSHPGASLSHAIPTTGATMPHPGLAAYVSQHHLAVGSRPSTTASTVTSSAASTIQKELLHAAHRTEGPPLGLAGAWR